MRVKRDFDRVYAEEDDPWSIGAADDPRYDLYRARLLAHVQGGRLLDIGCGLGAFLARFGDAFDELIGVETAAEAVRRGRELRPEIRFVQAQAEQLGSTDLDAETFDAIVVSDVLYYLRPAERAAVVAWTASHLRTGGHALVAAWCPGGRYLEPDELRALVRASLRIVDDVELPSQHVALVARPKLRLAAFTDVAPAGAVRVTDAESALAALPRERSPEYLRWRRRLGLRPPPPTGDELVAVAADETPALRRELERRGFRVVSPAELARAGR
jgi:SAM-dependent methyltransferase